MLAALLLVASPQLIQVQLKPVSPGKESGSLRWSPKGEIVELRPDGADLVGEFHLGLKDSQPIRVRLRKVNGAERYNSLSLDLNRDGSFSTDESWQTTPNERNGNWWSSFTTPDIPIPLSKGGARPYAINFWFVEDPTNPDAPKQLRWSRRGWHEGQVEIDGKPAYVLITEMRMDGVFDQRDAWFLARNREALLAASSRMLEDHAWLDGKAYRMTKIDPDGLTLEFQSFDPGVTQEEESQNRDIYAEDKVAKRAEKPLAFSHDFEKAADMAKSQGKRLFIDFEATWCGPCKTMDELVYTALDVVEAASGVVAVKVDGDVRKDLAEKFSVGAYPTMILLAPDGTEIRRAVGYRGVKAMVEFLQP
ncbi:thioredoxin family protein [Kamptonema cortianum]|nr:thioredoxin family protein [Geitlerinema splendidum]MDK3157569.1 thioredoxin family protein [Kamptonema cortianum]